jgi:PhnB protein
MAARKKTATKKPSKKTPAKSKAKVRAKPRKIASIPKGVHSITPKLCFKDAAFAMAFYEKAFGAKELYRLTEPGGKVGHGEIRIGDSLIMLSDEYPEMAILSAQTLGGSPIRLSIAVKNSDTFMAKAVASGATIIRPLTNEFYGWRSGVVLDPFGYAWLITSQIEVVSPKEMQKRWNKALASQHAPEAKA